MKLQLVVLNGFLQTTAHTGTGLQPQRHTLVKILHMVITQLLRLVHSHVGPLDELQRRTLISGLMRHANTGGEVNLLRANAVRLRHNRHHLVGQLFDPLRRIGQAVQHQQKLITGKPRQLAAQRLIGLQPLGQGAQQLIAHLQPQAVVN